MIANPSLPAYRYDPYEKRLTSEGYEHAEMTRMRAEAVDTARHSLRLNRADGTWAVILGTLGRQGSLTVLKVCSKSTLGSRERPEIAQAVTDHLDPTQHIPILLSELSPAKLTLLAPHVGVFVQTSCPRLSIDWGYAFPRPLLSPYEASIALDRATPWQKAGTYAMDFWADESGGEVRSLGSCALRTTC